MTTAKTLDEEEVRYRIVLDQDKGEWGSPAALLWYYCGRNYSTMKGVRQVVNRCIGKYNPENVMYHIEKGTVVWKWEVVGK